MRILHTSDLHLGITLCSQKLVEYQEKLTDILCDTVSQNNIDCVVIAGDIFDSTVASAEAISVWDDIVTSLCGKMNIPVVVCAGNHDGSARLSACSELLNSSGLYIRGRLSDVTKPVSIGDSDFYIIPYFNPNEVYTLFGAEKDKPAMEIVLDNIRSVMDKSRNNIVVAHCFVAGAKTSESDSSARASESVGGSDIVPVSIFYGFDYVALGHLHKAQTMKSENCSVRYSGTPFKYSFSECNHNKTFSIFDTDTKSVTEITVPPVIKLREIKDSYDNIMAIANADTNRNDFMKIVMTDRYKGEATFNTLKDIYPNLLIFQGVLYNDDEIQTFTAEEVFSLDMITLAKKYCENIRNKQPDEDEINWLNDALKLSEEEELQ